ncbi:FxLYD domain-containing protein [Methanobacterium oryzae]|uniref:FxLYD domain-containing protein n=1 Tax=Methanobacterium oryzae TaxID=69540 RepID=UPI003D248C4D
MYKKVLIIFLIFIMIGISGCTIDKGVQQTWGEKEISLNKIIILNNTTSDYYEVNGISYYYIEGYIQNNNAHDAFMVKMKATAYDKEGNIVAETDNVYLELKTIPAGEQSYFFFEFTDKNTEIVRYDIKLVDAKATAG